jgi:hypothetical protein
MTTTDEAAPRKSPTLDEDPLHGQRLTIRILDWPTGHVSITLNDKAGRPIAHVQSTVTHTDHLPISKEDAREWAQAIVYRFNIYDQLMAQLTRANAAAASPSSPQNYSPIGTFAVAETKDLLHRLWTKAKGTIGYDKEAWRELSIRIEGDPSATKARIDAMGEACERQIEEAKSRMEELARDAASERRHRELIAEHRYELEERLAVALARLEGVVTTIQNPETRP